MYAASTIVNLSTTRCCVPHADSTWLFTRSLTRSARSIDSSAYLTTDYKEGWSASGLFSQATKVHVAPFGGIQVCDYDEDWEHMGRSERVKRTFFNMITSPVKEKDPRYFGGENNIREKQ